MTTRQTGAEFVQVASGLSTDLVEIQRYVSASPNPYWATYNITLSNLLTGGLDFTLLNLGASGTAGTLNIFPATASKGNLKFVATNNTGNTITTITNAAMGQASIISVPDPANATAAFVLDHGNQTIAGNKTLTGTTQANTLNVGASGTVGSLSLFSTTAAKGSWNFAPVDNTGNTVMTITNAAQGGAYTYTIPNAGASTTFVMGAGTQTIAGVKTFSSIPIGTAQAIQVYLSPITAQAGAVSVLFQAPFAGTVTSIAAAVSGAFITTDIVITPSIYHSGSGTAITGGAVTVPTAGSGVATNATVTPSAANTFVSGDTITATITGGVNTINGVITLYVTRTA